MEPTVEDLAAIATRVRTASLRHDHPDKTWGGMGNGRRCDACRRSIEQAELELEADFDEGKTTLRFHAACFMAWQRAAEEWRRLLAN